MPVVLPMGSSEAAWDDEAIVARFVRAVLELPPPSLLCISSCRKRRVHRRWGRGSADDAAPDIVQKALPQKAQPQGMGPGQRAGKVKPPAVWK